MVRPALSPRSWSLAAACILLGATLAPGATVISNLPVGLDSNGDDFGPTGGITRAMGFEVGSSPITLSSVYVAVTNTLSTAAVLDVRIVTNSNSNDPLNFVTAYQGTFAGSFSSGAGNFHWQYDLTGNTVLNANTVYWLVLSIDIPNPDPDVSGKFVWNISDPSKTPTGALASHFGSRVSNNGGTSWTNDNQLFAYQLNGDVVDTRGSVPEPTTLGMMGLAVCGLLVRRWRR